MLGPWEQHNARLLYEPILSMCIYVAVALGVDAYASVAAVSVEPVVVVVVVVVLVAGGGGGEMVFPGLTGS